MRRVRTRVLPEPAPAITNSGPPAWVTAVVCAGLSPDNRFSVLSMSLSLLGYADGTDRR
ncbi:unannotated protein [freshwater metagenome]|uniref:Unannotated protein n=1 Tax=freshwater metagenome TaxID=449393 RepID=A0A6J6TLA2_9ZZZZ